MKTENNHISNNSFNMIQYKLSDFEFYKPSFDEVLDERLNKTPDFEINDPEFELLENNLVRYINPECPECKSHKIIKYGKEYKEKINTAGKITEYQEQQYYCKNCYHRFGIKNNPLTNENSKFLTEIKDKCITRLKEGYESLRQLSRNLKNYNNINVSHVSIHNWIKIDVDDTIINKQEDFSGYYLYDEEYLKINGKRQYRLTLYDMEYNIPLAERITDNKQYSTVLRFLKETTKYKPFKVLATDLFPMYRNIADELGVKHQLCLIHLNREINKKVKTYTRKNNLNNKEEQKINNKVKQYKQMFFANTSEEAIKTYKRYMKNIEEIPEPLKEFTKKHVQNHFKRYIEHYSNEKIDITTNKIENYYRQTDPNEIKSRYKTKQGILSYLYYKMEYWTENFKKN